MTTYQQIIIMQTECGSLRSAAVGWSAVGWSAEDSAQWRPGPIGLTPGAPFPYSYETPLAAMGHGWMLMAPPVAYETEDDRGKVTQHEWWFTRTVSR